VKTIEEMKREAMLTPLRLVDPQPPETLPAEGIVFVLDANGSLWDDFAKYIHEYFTEYKIIAWSYTATHEPQEPTQHEIKTKGWI